MKAVYVGIAITWSFALLAGRDAGTSAIASPIAATSAEITPQPTSTGGEVAGAPSMEPRDSADPRVDLLGNEIEDALADYRIDLGGGVYERHSPDTAVPRLACPTT